MTDLPPPRSTVGRINGPAGTYFVKRIEKPGNVTHAAAVRALTFIASHADDAEELREWIDCLGLNPTVDRLATERKAG